MTPRTLALVAVLFLATAPSAFAQSHQGGYLGLNPAHDLAARTVPTDPAPPAAPSGQGGYLGLNAGAHLGPVTPQPTTGPLAWCVNSPDPSHCRGRAFVEDQICHDAAHYDACRRAIDPMHNTK
jgi:hypothetical protein